MDKYQFGDQVFDTHTRQLQSASTDRPLRRKVAIVLQLLIENRHRVVTYEEILNTAWSNGKFRENSLLTLIAELRRILNDDVKSPKFIKTFHLNGYQWIHPNTKLLPVIPNQEKLTNANPPHVLLNVPRKRKTHKHFSLFTIILVIISTLVVFNTDHSKPLAQKTFNEKSQKVIVLPFVNHTNNASLDWLELGFSDMIASNLSRLQSIHIVPQHIVQASFAKLPSTNLSELNLDSLQDEFQTDFIIQATISQRDKDYLISTKIRATESKEYYFEKEYRDLLEAMSDISINIATKLLPKRNDITFKLAFSKNKQANSDYAKGLQAYFTTGPKLSRHYFEAALINDPNFLWAKAYLALTLNQLGQWQQSENLFKLTLKDAIKQNRLNLETFIHLGLANSAFFQESYVEAESHLFTAMNIANRNDDKFSEAEATWRLSKIREIEANWQAQYDLQQKALSIIDYKDNTRTQADNLFYLGSPSNSRLETNPDLNVKENRARLTQALSYYQKLNFSSKIASTLLASAKNYDFSFEKRIAFLEKAEKIFDSTGEKMQLSNTLAYHGYLYIQYRQGRKAIPVIERAKAINLTLKSTRPLLRTQFLLAFANLDRGINERSSDPEKFLQKSIKQFKNVIQSIHSLEKSSLLAGSYTLLGWAYSEMNNHNMALKMINKGKTLYHELQMPLSVAYCDMSIIKEYLDLKEWQSAITFNDAKNLNKREKFYIARAYYEEKNYQKAFNVAIRIKTEFTNDWNKNDEKKLKFYEQMQFAKIHTLLPPEESAHSKYCESV